MRTQFWRPDTCGCAFHQIVDDDGEIKPATREEAQAVLDERRRTNPLTTTTEDLWPDAECAAHRGFPVAARYALVLDENQRKNRVFGELEKLGVTPEQYVWTFDENRVLDVLAEGIALTAQEKLDLQTAANRDHGFGRVRVR